MKKAVFLSVFSIAACLLTNCQDAQPIQQYSLADLFSEPYVASLDRDSTHTLFNFPLCQDNKKSWDSILFIKPYINESLIKNLSIQNYGSIQQMVHNQSLSESTYTLAFVSKGRYVAFGVFLRSPIDFNTLETNKSYAWINRKNCNNLYFEKSRISNKSFYSLHQKNNN